MRGVRTRRVKKPRFSQCAHTYQKKGIEFLLTHGAAALLLDPG
jgi:hypothetical protein